MRATLAFRSTLTLVLLSGAVAAAAWLALHISPVVAWLFSINLVTFAVFGYDKTIAGSAKRRIPEKSLLSLSALGGTPGAWAGMIFFRHKTAKLVFMRLFWIIVGIQAVLVAAYFLWLV